MNNFLKIILSIPALPNIFYLITYWFPANFKWLIRIEETYYLQQIITFLLILVLITLIRRIWRFKNVPSQVKTNWTMLLIFFNMFTILLFIWYFDDKMIDKNNAIEREMKLTNI